MHAEPIQRKYALTKVAAGDYLLPSNDGKTIWRIARYTDGPSSGIAEWPRDREVWGLWFWRGETGVGTYVDARSWDRWEMRRGLLATRADAIRLAMHADAIRESMRS